jgi:hypothetical protein
MAGTAWNCARESSAAAVRERIMTVCQPRISPIDEYEFAVQPRLAGHGPTTVQEATTTIHISFATMSDPASGN